MVVVFVVLVDVVLVFVVLVDVELVFVVLVDVVRVFVVLVLVVLIDVPLLTVAIPNGLFSWTELELATPVPTTVVRSVPGVAAGHSWSNDRQSSSHRFRPSPKTMDHYAVYCRYPDHQAPRP